MRIIGRVVLPLLLWLGGFAPAHAQQKAYTNEQLASDAVRLEAQVRKDAAVQSPRPLDQIRREVLAAAARNDTNAALRALAQVAAPDTKNAANWLNYARTALAVPQTSSLIYQLRNQAATASY